MRKGLLLLVALMGACLATTAVAQAPVEHKYALGEPIILRSEKMVGWIPLQPATLPYTVINEYEPIEAEDAADATDEAKRQGDGIPPGTFNATNFVAGVGTKPATFIVYEVLSSGPNAPPTFVQHRLVIGTPKPTPDPVDPDVDPTPDPDVDPEPNPDDEAPIPVDGLHVLILYESEKTLPSGQQAILAGEATRNWLDANCSRGEDGEPTYRIFDKDVDLSAEFKIWQDAVARAKATKDVKYPWLIVSNGTTGFEGPLQNTPEEFLPNAEKFKKK